MNDYKTKVKIIFAVLLILLVVDILLIIIPVHAEDHQPNAWVLRRNADNVLIKKDPSSTEYDYRLFIDNDPPCGSELYLTGESRGKWQKCICLYLPDAPEGWIHSGFVAYDKPEECGLLATVTKPVTIDESIGGRAAWLCSRGERVKILYRSKDYCTTIWGFIPSSVLSFEKSDKAVTQPKKANAQNWSDWIKRDHILCVIDWW